MAEIMDLTRVVIALARCQDGVLVVDEVELTDLPPRASIHRTVQPDGTVVITVAGDGSEFGSTG